MNKKEQQIRKQIIYELKELLDSESNIYIYGAGKVANRLYDVIEKIGYESRISSFVTTLKIEGNKSNIIDIDSVYDRQALFLIAVGDIYQNEIVYELNKRGFYNTKDAYLYSLIYDASFSATIPTEIPVECIINKNELLIMQFHNGDFMRYDMLLVEEEHRRKQHCDVINIDLELKILDDAMTTCFLLDSSITDVRVRQNLSKKADLFDVSWLKQRSNDLQMNEIESRLSQYKKSWQSVFVGIIWPPAYSLSSEISEIIQQETKLIEEYEISLNQKNVEEFIKEIYAVDDVSETLLKKKIIRIMSESELKLHIFEFYLESPDFRIKRFGHTISTYGMNLKSRIRDEFKSQIENYVHDVVFHTGDNFQHSKKIIDIIRKYEYY